MQAKLIGGGIGFLAILLIGLQIRSHYINVGYDRANIEHAEEQAKLIEKHNKTVLDINAENKELTRQLISNQGQSRAYLDTLRSRTYEQNPDANVQCFNSERLLNIQENIAEIRRKSESREGDRQ